MKRRGRRSSTRGSPMRSTARPLRRRRWLRQRGPASPPPRRRRARAATAASPSDGATRRGTASTARSASIRAAPHPRPPPRPRPSRSTRPLCARRGSLPRAKSGTRRAASPCPSCWRCWPRCPRPCGARSRRGSSWRAWSSRRRRTSAAASSSCQGCAAAWASPRRSCRTCGARPSPTSSPRSRTPLARTTSCGWARAGQEAHARHSHGASRRGPAPCSPSHVASRRAAAHPYTIPLAPHIPFRPPGGHLRRAPMGRQRRRPRLCVRHPRGARLPARRDAPAGGGGAQQGGCARQEGTRRRQVQVRLLPRVGAPHRAPRTISTPPLYSLGVDPSVRSCLARRPEQRADARACLSPWSSASSS